MKLTNLWYYYFGESVNSASAEFDFDADAVGQVIAPAVEKDDSRGWRYHAHARAGQVRAQVRTGRVTVNGAGVAPVQGIRAFAQVGKTSVKAAARPQAASLRRGADVRSAQVVASSQHAQASIPRAFTRVGQVVGEAGVAVTLQGRAASVRTGRANVVIGPDLVEQEFEEILLLLEVA